MNWRSIALGLLAIAHAGLPTATASVPPQELATKLSAVAILPAIVEDEGKELSTAARMIEDRIAVALQARGFKVQDVGTYRTLAHEHSQALGGVYDPYTGRPIEARSDEVRDRTVSALRERYGVTGFVLPTIEPHSTSFDHADRVAWDGVEENIVAAERPIDFLWRALGARDGGKVRVLSLKVEIFDKHMERLYEGRGGVGAAATFVNGAIAQVDIPTVLGDAARMTRAVNVALEPMTPGTKRTSDVVQFQGVERGWRSKSTLPLRAEPVAEAALTREEIRSVVPVVVLMPLDTMGHPKRDEVREHYEAALADVLTGAGFRVEPADVYAAAVATARRQVGGTYDPVTGEELPEKRQLFRAAVQRKLSDARVDGVVNAAIVVRRAPYDTAGVARWDGIEISGAAKEAARGEVRPAGVQPAFSLSVTLADLSERNLYMGRGGIELINSVVNGDLKARPFGEMLLDASKAQRAAKVALGGIAK